MRKDIVRQCIGIALGLLGIVLHAGPAYANEAAEADRARVLHFPVDQCVGDLYGKEASPVVINPRNVTLTSAGSYLGMAQGDVIVPSDQEIRLVVHLALDPKDAARLRRSDPSFYDFVTVRCVRQGPYDLSGLSRLNANDLHTLTVNSAKSRVGSDRRVLEPIKHLTGLRVLDLSNTGVTDEGLEHIRPLRQLRAISFYQERLVKNNGLAVLKDLPALEYLDLDTGATDAGLKHLAQVPNLRALRIRTGRIWGPGLAELASAPRLERLCLWGEARITDRQVAYLEGLTQLKSLTLCGGDCRLTDASLASIAKLENLEELYFINMAPRFTPAGLEQLRKLTKLRKVDFGQTWGGRAGDLYGSDLAQQLAAMPQLESIEGAGNFLPEDIKALGALPRLKRLHVSLKDRRNGYVSPIGLAHLASLDSLEDLCILTMDTLSEADLAGLEQLHNLKHLVISSHGVTEDGVALIGKLRSLEYLDIDPITRSALNHLNGLSNLQSLRANGFWGQRMNLAQSDEGTLNLSELTRLRDLTLQGLSLQDDDLAFLDHTPSVEYLMIESATPLTGTSLRRFGELTELEHLWITGLSRCPGNDMAALNGLSKLRQLTLRGEVSAAALASLDDLPALFVLNVDTTELIPKRTAAALREQLESMTLLHINALPPEDRPTSIPRRR